MKLVILDRDGVINQDSDAYIKSVEEWIPIEGSIEAIAKLSQNGFTVVVATNQSGIGRGYFDIDELEAMHSKLAHLVADKGGTIAGIFYCPHSPEDNCECRKPAPGLLDAISMELPANLAGATVIGDSLRDLEAGVKRGCQPILVRTGKGEKTLASLANHPNTAINQALVFDDLAAVVEYLLLGS